MKCLTSLLAVGGFSTVSGFSLPVYPIEEDNNPLDCYDALQCSNYTISHYDIECNALLACYGSNMTYEDGGDPECYGESSCAMTTITAVPEDEGGDEYYNYNYECLGDRACADANFVLADDSTFYLYSYLSLTGSYVNTSSYSNQPQFRFRGPFAGRDATLRCFYGQDCELECHGNGCNGLKLMQRYDEDNNNNNEEMYEYEGYDIDCTYSEMNDLCPDGYELGMYANYIPDIPEGLFFVYLLILTLVLFNLYVFEFI